MPKSKQKRKGNRSLFTKNKENGGTSTHLKPIASTSPLRRLYQHINDLPLYLFVDCIVDKRYPVLVIHGTFTQEEILNAWYLIVDQYNAALGDSENKLSLSLYKIILTKETDYEQILCAINVLSSIYDQYFANALNKLLGTQFKFDPSDADAYLDMLKRCKNRAKGIKLELDRRKLEFEAIQQRQEGEKTEPTREYFQTILINLSDYAKYQIDDKIKVFEFCERVKRLAKYLEKMQR
jgi:hypothetical protein